MGNVRSLRITSPGASGFVCYLILKIICPDTARKVREKVAGPGESES